MPNESNNSGHSLGSSLGAGIKSIFGAGGRRYYILEHKTATAGHRAGDVRRIIVDYIEIGRDTRCQIRYGEDCPTVSRRHAAISKAEDGETWRLTPLSHTNDTLVNGKRVTAPVQLHNGDEIQLSTDGPRLGFIMPEGVELIIHAELGIVSAGKAPKEGDENYDPYHVVDAGGSPASVAYGGGKRS